MATSLKVFSVRNREKGTTLATQATLASSYWSRFWGLMLRRSISDGGGILLTKSSSIHSFFMFFRFDAIYLDRENRVVKIEPSMRQWWVSFGGKGAKDTLELPAGTAERTGTVAGDTLVFDAPEPEAAAA